MTLVKILVAEDDIHIRQGLVDTLESESYHVVEAENGNRAFEAFKNNALDLLLLDIMMPEKSGYEVCREVRAVDPDIPIILLTAKGEEIDKVVGLKLGADDYITKPFGVHELLARIAAVLRRSNRQKEKQNQPDMNCFTFGGHLVNPKAYTLSKKNPPAFRLRVCPESPGRLDPALQSVGPPWPAQSRNVHLSSQYSSAHGSAALQWLCSQTLF